MTHTHTIITGPYHGQQSACIAQYNHFSYSHTAGSHYKKNKNPHLNPSHHSNSHLYSQPYTNYQHYTMPPIQPLVPFNQYGMPFWG